MSRFVKKSGRPPRSQSRFVKKSGRPPRSQSRPDPTRFLSRFYPPRDISPMVGVRYLAYLLPAFLQARAFELSHVPVPALADSMLAMLLIVNASVTHELALFGARFTKVLGASTKASTNEKLANPQFLVTGYCLNNSLPCSCSPAGSSGSGLGCWSLRASSSG